MAFRRYAAVALVLLATLGSAAAALAVFSVDRDLSVGTVRLSTDPGHAGALDIYVPLVDWGVRFDAVRLPVRLSLDLRSLNRTAVAEVARGRDPDVEALRGEAEDAIGSYIRRALLVSAIVALGMGILVALALRGRAAPLRLTLPAVGVGVLVAGLAIIFLLPPRGAIEDPEYYANGPDIPAALRAIDQATGTADTISQELNDQLVGLARLIAAPGARGVTGELPHLTLASDLHNNLLALPTLERAVRRGPLFFAGDLTSAGSPFEAALTRRVASIGDPFVFVTGNHDSDTLARRLADAGAIVLTRRGRLLPGGRLGAVVVNVEGLRVAGYDDPYTRRSRNGYRKRGAEPTEAQRRAFAAWLRPLIGRVDVVMTHGSGLTELAVQELKEDPPARPLAILTGHTHVSALKTSENLVELNGGTVGGGGTGNLEKNQPFGLAVLVWARSRAFSPLLADIVEIDAVTGAAKAERRALDLDPESAAAGG
jgi:predicted phosphodiesterase